MKESYTGKRRVRRTFGRIDAVSDMPSLIEVQTGSYADFIENKNCEFGLENVFKSIFPIFESTSSFAKFIRTSSSSCFLKIPDCVLYLFIV